MPETHHAAATFTVDAWEEAPQPAFPEEAGVLQATLRKTFAGDLVGTSTVLMLMTQNDEARAYVAQEYVTAALHGRKGTFILQHSAVDEGGEARGAWLIVPGSGTGDLEGLRGTATFQHDARGARLTLDYRL